MQRSFGGALLLLAAAAVAIVVVGFGLAPDSASSDPGDPGAAMRQMPEEMPASLGGMGTGGHTSAEMDEMHSQMSARLSEEDRELHDRMHVGCRDVTHERNER
ncbi:MAG: hypothetical protein M3N68_12240 [Actinomycetota bacterium]|nr:hypothetical protein [Actinomycetota bacterium]